MLFIEILLNCAPDLPGGVTFVDRHREAAVSSEADIKKELKVSESSI